MIDQLNATAHDGTRILLSPFLPGDVGRVFELCQDADIQRWTTIPSPYSMSNAEQYVNEYTPPAWREVAAGTFSIDGDGPELAWGIRLASDGLVGAIGLKPYGDRCMEIGWWLGASWRGRGIMHAAAETVVGVGFAQLDAAEIRWRAAVGNYPSAFVAQRIGLAYQGVVRTDRGIHKDEPHWSAAIRTGDPIAPRDDWPKL